MKHLHFLVIFSIIAFSSCSVYKNSQTPDDVYYSPGPPKDDSYVAARGNNQEVDYYNNQSDYVSTPPSDQYVRMRVEDPSRWSYFDDYAYDAYTPLGYGGYGGYGYGGLGGLSLGFGIGGFGYYNPFSYWNSYYAWNSYYNPYYGGVIVVGSKYSSPYVATRLRPFNAGTYASSSGTGRYNNNNRPSSFSPYSSRQGQVRSNSFGTTLRRVFSGDNNSGSGNQTMRTYSPSSSGGGGGGGGARTGGGGGGVSRPGR